MKETKFRAWQINHKVMCKVKNVHFNDNGDIESITLLYPESHASQIITYSDSNKLFWMCDKDGKYVLELMQYTGVRDKNGKEVYEGDILQGDSGKVYEIVWGEQHLLWIAKTNETHCNCYSPRVAEISVIVGNIHENPGLLKRR